MSTIQSYLSFTVEEIDNRLKEVITNDSEISALQTYMNSYAKVSDLTAYAKTADLATYAKTSDLVNLASKTDLTAYAKTADIATYYAAKTDLDNLTSKIDLTAYAKTADLASYASISYVNSSIATEHTASEISLDYADSVYTVKQGAKTIGNINIPKDMFVQSGYITTNPEGVGEGTYIKLILNSTYADPIYINVKDLANVYHTAVVQEGSTNDVAIVIDGKNYISAHVTNLDANKVNLYDATNGTYSNLNTEFFTTKSNISYANAYINTLNTEVSTVNGYVGTLQSDMATAQGKIAILNGDSYTVGSVSYAAALVTDNFQTVLDMVGYSFMDMDKDVTTLKTYTGTLQTYVGTLQSDMKTAQKNITGLQTDATDLNIAVNTLRTYVTTLQHDMTLAESSITILNGDEHTAGSVYNKIKDSTYLESYDLNTNIAALTKRVTYLESLVIK